MGVTSKGRFGRFLHQHEQLRREKSNLTHSLLITEQNLWLIKELDDMLHCVSRQQSRCTVSSEKKQGQRVRIYRNDVQQFSELSVAVDLFFPDCVCVSEWVCKHYIFVHMNIVNAVFTCFLSGWAATEGNGGRDKRAGPQDVFVKLETIPGFSSVPSFLLEKSLAAKVNNSSANLSFKLTGETFQVKTVSMRCQSWDFGLILLP